MKTSSSIEECYRTLGINPNASVDEIKKRYRSLVKTYHPDICKDISKEEAGKRIQEITEAYKTIMMWKKLEDSFKASKSEVFSSGKSTQSNAESTEVKDLRKSNHKRSTIKASKSFFPSNFHPYIKKRKTQIIGAVILVFIALITFLLIDDSNHRRSNFPAESRKVLTVSSGPSNALRPGDIPRPRETRPLTNGIPLRSFFTIGSTENEVLAVQGDPDRRSANIWYYRLSRVMFKDGIVVGYDNFDGSLKVRLLPKNDVLLTGDYFTLGSTQDEVILVQGTPSRVMKDVWYYGFDRVFFQEDGNKKLVGGYDNTSGTLKVKIAPSSTLKRGYFTIGDSQEDVVAVQGMPQKVIHNKWFYGAFYVVFDKGKVVNVGPVPGDGGGILKFLPQQPLSKQNGVNDEH